MHRYSFNTHLSSIQFGLTESRCVTRAINWLIGVDSRDLPATAGVRIFAVVKLDIPDSDHASSLSSRPSL